MVKDLVGVKFGKLTVIEQHGFTKRNIYGSRYALWYCQCDCGNFCERNTSTLSKRENHSCGCLNQEHLKEMSKNNTKHGMTRTGIYYSYKAMMSRCYRKKDIHYHAYGERGISVCDEWRNNPTAFIKWGLAHGWADGLTLERIDVDGNYEPSNCKWIPREEQYKNKQSQKRKRQASTCTT